MLDNKVKYQTYTQITHEDQQYNTPATQTYNIVIFIRDVLFLYMSFGNFL